MLEIRNWSSIVIVMLQFLSDALGNCQIKGISGEVLCQCFQNVEDLRPLISSQLIHSIKLYLENLTNDEVTIDELKSSLEYRQILLYMIIRRSNLTTFSSKLATLNGLRYLGIGGNNIKSINLNILPLAKDLFALDVSNNGIKDFEEESTTYVSTKKLESINLNHNKLYRIPLNCFYSTRESIKIIDLSHNEISSIDNYAFSHLTLLKILRLSHNKLVTISVFLYPLRNLENLYVDHNNIQDINADIFTRSTHLKYLNISSNSIEAIADHAFSALTNLKILNLKNNKVKSIKESLLHNSIHLESLDLSYNNLSYIEPGAFSMLEDLKNIDLKAALAMSLKTHVFTGLKVSELSLAGSKINEVVGTPFMTLGNSLQSLNLSSCMIQKISGTAFDSFDVITQIDLSNNNLTELGYLKDYRKGSLAKLSRLFLQNNSISEIKAETFQHLLYLTELDLSNNKIKIMPPMAFKNLKNLENVTILNNELENTLLSNTFFGLDSVQHLELSNTKYKRWDTYALTGLKNLKLINASHGELVEMDFKAFTGTNNIQVLDLSYNQIKIFNISLTSNERMKEIYLNNNKLTYVLKHFFEGFALLEILNLANNELASVDPSAFRTVKALKHLDLSYNTKINIVDNAFDNLNLRKLCIKSINNITFKFQNVTIEKMDLAYSKISNLSYLYLSKITGLDSVDLSYNNLCVIDRFSFGNGIDSLKSLNLSHNKIAKVNPGSFLNTTGLLHLDLSYNMIKVIEFGAFRGLRSLMALNISNNKLSTFNLALLYDIQSVTSITLDDNLINNIGFIENTYGLNTLSVGGNRILCDELVHLQSYFKLTLTAKTLVFFNENVDGITCFSNISTFNKSTTNKLVVEPRADVSVKTAQSVSLKRKFRY